MTETTLGAVGSPRRLRPGQTLGQLLDDRYSCRAFLPEQVPREVIEQILALAQRTPSWCNTQPWQVAITEGAATDRFRGGLAEALRTVSQAPDIEFPREYRGVYRDRRRECALQLYSSLGSPETARPRPGRR